MNNGIINVVKCTGYNIKITNIKFYEKTFIPFGWS